jgi:hypothetical protein
MGKASRDNGIRRKLHIRFKLRDGRVNTLIVWEDGEWKVEIFASQEHAEQFAKFNKMEVVSYEDNNST